MERLYVATKNSLVKFKLDYCCWLAPIRVGIFIISYLNILISLISIIGTANESFSPVIMKIQEALMEEHMSKPIPILSYCTELGFNVLLLCAMYRKDIVLAQVFMYYNIATAVACTLVYSMVIPAVDLLLCLTIITSVFYQFYLLILVRSVIVEMKEELNPNKNGFVFSTLQKKDVELEQEKDEKLQEEKDKIVEEPSTSDPETMKEDMKKEREKLETVEEDPNEIRIELNPSKPQDQNKKSE